MTVRDSLTALRDPNLDLASMLCQLVLDIRQILVCESPTTAKLAAIAEAIDELAPPPPPLWTPPYRGTWHQCERRQACSTAVRAMTLPIELSARYPGGPVSVATSRRLRLVNRVP